MFIPVSKYIRLRHKYLLETLIFFVFFIMKIISPEANYISRMEDDFVIFNLIYFDDFPNSFPYNISLTS
jgi:hypothetical protein